MDLKKYYHNCIRKKEKLVIRAAMTWRSKDMTLLPFLLAAVFLYTRNFFSKSFTGTFPVNCCLDVGEVWAKSSDESVMGIFWDEVLLLEIQYKTVIFTSWSRHWKSSLEQFWKKKNSQYSIRQIGNVVISFLWQLWCHCNPCHNKFSSF